MAETRGKTYLKLRVGGFRDRPSSGSGRSPVEIRPLGIELLDPPVLLPATYTYMAQERPSDALRGCCMSSVCCVLTSSDYNEHQAQVRCRPRSGTLARRASPPDAILSAHQGRSQDFPKGREGANFHGAQGQPFQKRKSHRI